MNNLQEIYAAIGYARCSSKEQSKGGSLSRQSERLTAFALQHGWSIQIITDEGFSAYKGDHRKAGQCFAQFEAEAMAGAHIGKILIIERLDRLSRQSPQKTYRLICDLVGAGVAVATCDDGKIYEAYREPELIDILTIIIKAEGNHQESAKKSAHIAREWQKRQERAAETGKALTKTVQPWLHVDADRNILVIQDRGALVHRMFQLADQGYGSGAIMRLFNQERITPWGRYDGRKPRVWGRTFIARIMSNRAVIGEFQPMRLDETTGKRVPNGEPWQNYFPAVVPRDLFERVHSQASGRKAVFNHVKKSLIANLFGSKVKCKCGAGMRYTPSRREGTVLPTKAGGTTTLRRTNASFVCPVAKGGSAKCNNQAHWAYLTFEDAVLNSVLHLAMDDQNFANNGEAGRLRNLIAGERRAYDLAMTKASTLYDAYAENPSPIMLARAQQLEAEANTFEQNIAMMEQQQNVALGKTSSQQHLKRVKDIQASLYDPDLDIRIPLRRKVALSVQSLIRRIDFTEDCATVTLENGVGCLIFNRKGKLAFALDKAKTGKKYPATGEYMRRRETAKAAGPIFGLVEPDGRPISLNELIMMMTA